VKVAVAAVQIGWGGKMRVDVEEVAAQVRESVSQAEGEPNPESVRLDVVKIVGRGCRPCL
jgi:hypothetical protein